VKSKQEILTEFVKHSADYINRRLSSIAFDEWLEKSLDQYAAHVLSECLGKDSNYSLKGNENIFIEGVVAGLNQRADNARQRAKDKY